MSLLRALVSINICDVCMCDHREERKRLEFLPKTIVWSVGLVWVLRVFLPFVPAALVSKSLVQKFCLDVVRALKSSASQDKSSLLVQSICVLHK